MVIPKENLGRWEKYYDIERKTKNSKQTFNHLIKLVLNFELGFLWYLDLYTYIYIYIYIHTYNICIYIRVYISQGAKVSIVFFN
jgi:hypothetical protein